MLVRLQVTCTCIFGRVDETLSLSLSFVPTTRYMSDTDLARQNQVLKAHVDHQEKELVTLRHEALEQSDSRGQGGAGACGAKDEQTRKLQSKVQRLQEELTDKLRLEVQGTTSQLNMSKEIQDLFQKWQLSRAEAEKLRTEVDGFRAREATLEAQ